MANGLAIVLSGGGAKGAFQVGVLDELISRRGIGFNIFVGVSTGAIQALAGAQDDIPGLLREWLALRGNRDVYKGKFLGLIGGLFGADSIYSAKPIRERINAFADEEKLRATGKKLLIGVVNLGSGAFRSVDENSPNIADWVYASSAMPVYFEPLTTRDAMGREEQWVDGGVRNVTPLAEAMNQNPRAILVVKTAPPPVPPQKPGSFDGLIKIGLRSIDILQQEVSLNDTANAGLINDLIAARAAQEQALANAGITGDTAAAILAPLDRQISEYRFVPIRIVQPKQPVSETLEFDPVRIRAAIEAGRQLVSDQWEELEAFLS